MTKLFMSHVRLTPAVGWVDLLVRRRAIIDDAPNLFEIPFSTTPNHMPRVYPRFRASLHEIFVTSHRRLVGYTLQPL